MSAKPPRREGAISSHQSIKNVGGVALTKLGTICDEQSDGDRQMDAHGNNTALDPDGGGGGEDTIL